MALNRGPIDPNVLYDQNIHRSETVWDDRNTPEINCRRREAVVQRTIPLHRNILPLLHASGFYGLARLGFIQLVWHLITALLERWRPETHTFHMPVGECTITLQDVEVLVGLPADGESVIGQMHDDWLHVCQELLGVIPPPEQIRGQRLSLTWLGAEFHELANDADEETITPNLHHTGRYSWGGACLAWLYRQLCTASKQGVREIAGPLILLQIWAWERFPIVAPQLLHVNANQLHGRVYGSRYMFDLLQPSQIVWEPYKTVINSLPHFCTNGHDIWRTISPLICFYIGEWHHPDRVLRQFGIQQVVPCDCNTEPLLHNIDLRTTDWSDRVAHLVMRWHNRRRFTATGPPIEQFDMDVTQEYINWYKNISKLYITQPGAAMSHLRSNNIRLRNVADDPQQVLNICNDNE
uniref:Aminotransferase-like plant mobile domain-containing protein n=1 Tax=Cucumis melo TaxID=3656 RepID=A0A9I9E861_CUCME